MAFIRRDKLSTARRKFGSASDHIDLAHFRKLEMADTGVGGKGKKTERVVKQMLKLMQYASLCQASQLQTHNLLPPGKSFIPISTLTSIGSPLASLKQPVGITQDVHDTSFKTVFLREGEATAGPQKELQCGTGFQK
jgi:hypothetical protein